MVNQNGIQDLGSTEKADDLLLPQTSSGVVLADQGSPSVMQHVVSVESSSLLSHIFKM